MLVFGIILKGDIVLLKSHSNKCFSKSPPFICYKIRVEVHDLLLVTSAIASNFVHEM